MDKKPEILAVRTLGSSRLFELQAVDLQFANGATAEFERVATQLAGAVCVVPITADGDVLLIREYGVGVDRYELALPKGKVEQGEAVLEAANREIMEEVGHGARELELLKVVTIAPGYFQHRTHLVLATDLYPCQREGDEPEPLEVVPWPMSQLDELFQREDFTEARSMAALVLARSHLGELEN